MIRNRLLEIRLQMGYKKQLEFAEKVLGLSQQAYNKIENNKKQVTLEAAFEIAEKLKMPIEDIFYKSKE